MDDQVTGLVLPGDDAAAWASAIDALLGDEPRRQRMARTAPQRMSRYCLGKTLRGVLGRARRGGPAGADEAATTGVNDPAARRGRVELAVR